ncbi:hypothetical protein EV421DRAFT_1909780 [Armillaria borealis]|uniref:F-box domain-containing protein n=1 Tax=Armillaria borealis TaxID=47425 RepID=A0AA39J3U8_9AGAR|nr:hypothetical protein EV421DRAFT_1909780 [Armillaria borealis]
MNSTLYNLADDVLIYTIAFLSVPDILLLRQTCKWIHALTRLRVVWTNVFKLDIISNNYPFALDDTDLDHRTCHAYRLASRWLTLRSPLIPKSETTFVGSPGSGLSLPFGISPVTLQQKFSEWSLKGAMFTAVKLNADPESEASMAVSLELRFCTWMTMGFCMKFVSSIPISDLRPVTINGDVIALDDGASKTLVYNWKTDKHAHLDDVGNTQHDHCLQVVFTPPIIDILVVRARSITLYAAPPRPTRVATHSFGWDDGASATPTSILIRSQNDNLWALELNSLELHSLSLLSSNSRLQNIVLMWNSPMPQCHPWGAGHCRMDPPTRPRHAVFPDPLNPTAKVRIREVYMNNLNNWIALDYDKDLGRITLGSGFRKIMIV